MPKGTAENFTGDMFKYHSKHARLAKFTHRVRLSLNDSFRLVLLRFIYIMFVLA